MSTVIGSHSFFVLKPTSKIQPTLLDTTMMVVLNVDKRDRNNQQVLVHLIPVQGFQSFENNYFSYGGRYTTL